MHKKELPEGVMMLASPAEKYYWINKNVFLLRDDIVWKKNPETDNEVLLIPKPMKHYWINKNVFLLRDDIVWKKNPETDNEVLLIPKPMRKELIEINHNIPAA